MTCIEARGLRKTYRTTAALDGVDLRVEEGRILGLIGPNGAGKTTVFNVASGFYKPSQGSVVFKGKDTRGLKPHKVTALGVARTFQNIRLWHELSVLDNIRLGAFLQPGDQVRFVIA